MPLTLSDDGRFAATAGEKELKIHSLKGDGDVRPISLQDLTGPVKYLQWATGQLDEQPLPGQRDENITQRVLCAGGNKIFVYDANEETWSAKIDAGEITGLAHASFSPSGDEIIVIPEFNTHLTIISLTSGHQRVIKCPKFAGHATYAFRPRSGHLAVLTKGNTGDILSLHEVGSYEVITAVNIPTTDARGLKWSPDGNWIAVWDTASQGTMVVIYTADGQRFRNYEGSSTGDDDRDFGVRTVEWSPDSQLLAIGKHDGTVELISGTAVCLSILRCNKVDDNADFGGNRQFVLMAVLGDPTTEPIGRDVYVEQESMIPDITDYMLAPESPVFPYTYNLSAEDRIVSNISFNPTSSAAVTIDESMPNIAWMWSVEGSKPTLSGALVHSANIKQLCWNSEIPDLLMTMSGDDTTVAVHQWLCGRTPRGAIIRSLRGRAEVGWIKTDKEMGGLLWIGGQRGYEMGYLTGTGSSTQLHKVAAVSDVAELLPPLSDADFPLTKTEK
ncbi:hypothetical protein GY631_3286 [Trichophyton interdigitale]|uniref:Uncharacterized protein n=1 Tax=Trichophyton interdigitale TaxID=101480 RepID=A0A9P4YGC2_9EURO|nr:hypothetical protein GY631_3286 [Trichophyton interdigitale]KAF3896338.1 hypothetical protein GY632_2862 [Trichophyton interdigitale]